MGKKALFSYADDLQPLFDKPWQEPHLRVTKLNDALASRLFNTPAQLGDRDHIETDKTKLQYLPYNPVLHVHDDFTADVFLYRRGKSGTEARLHDKWSIGLGGHVEESVTPEINLENILLQSTIRELEEEVGFRADTFAIREQLHRAWLVNDTRTDTEAVHMGLFFPVFAKKHQLGQAELDQICDGQWVAVTDLAVKHLKGEINLEPWSVFVLHEMLVPTFRPLNTIAPPVPPEMEVSLGALATFGNIDT